MASKTTTDHDEIRKWVEARGGCPAHVIATGKKRDPGILRIDYEGFSGVDTLEPIEWDDWFAAFDANKLAFVYDTAKKSRFSKLIARSTARAKAKTTARTRAPAKRTTTAKKRTTPKARAKKTGARRTAARARA